MSDVIFTCVLLLLLVRKVSKLRVDSVSAGSGLLLVTVERCEIIMDDQLPDSLQQLPTFSKIYSFYISVSSSLIFNKIFDELINKRGE